MTVMELYKGARDKKEFVELKQFLGSLEVAVADEEANRMAMQWAEQFCLSHAPIDIPDLTNGTIAVLGDFQLHTDNKKHFRHRPAPLANGFAGLIFAFSRRMNLGYACINLTLQSECKIMTNRGMIQRTFREKGLQYASQLALQNVRDLLEIVRWNEDHGVGIFRVSSDVFPWASEYRLPQLPDFPEIRELLEAVGRTSVRLTTHPGPFNKLAGEGATLKNTLGDLEHHSEVFDHMGLVPSHRNKINIHVGGAYGDKAETLLRFARNFEIYLSENLKKRLNIENDDKPGLYTVAELLPLYETIGTPIAFDYFHHSLHSGGLSEREAFELAVSTWTDATPVCHYSNSRRTHEDPTAKREAHSDWVYNLVQTYGHDIDIMFEAKMKELALMKYREEFLMPQPASVFDAQLPESLTRRGTHSGSLSG